MFCLAALIILALLSVFSATHRQLAREAFGCVWDRARLRPCEAAFSERVKADVIAWLMPRNLVLAKTFNRYAEVLAWAFVILSIASTLYVARGVFYLITQGTCNPGDPSSCIFNFGRDDLDEIEKRLRGGY